MKRFRISYLLSGYVTVEADSEEEALDFWKKESVQEAIRNIPQDSQPTFVTICEDRE